MYPGQIYEVCGTSSSGKTQLCFTIASNVALKPNNLVRYIDTKRDFCGSRVEEILLRKNCDKQVLVYIKLLPYTVLICVEYIVFILTSDCR